MPTGRVQSKQKCYTRSRNLQFCTVSTTFCTVADKTSCLGLGLLFFFFFLQKTRGWTGWGARRASTQHLCNAKQSRTAKGLQWKFPIWGKKRFFGLRRRLGLLRNAVDTEELLQARSPGMAFALQDGDRSRQTGNLWDEGECCLTAKARHRKTTGSRHAQAQQEEISEG